MVDRLTQLQQSVNTLAAQLCDSVGVVHMQHDGYLQQPDASDKVAAAIATNVGQFVDCLVVSSANIDTLIKSLPTLQDSNRVQQEAFAKASDEAVKAVDDLKMAVAKAEAKLQEVRAVFSLVTDAHYAINENHNVQTAT